MNTYSSTIRRAAVLAIVLTLAGCASKSPAPVDDRGGSVSASAGTYTVKSGDTLYSIARDHGMDYRELIALNRIENPNRIVAGRVLKIKPSATTGSAVAMATPIVSDVVETRPIVTETVPQTSSVAAPAGNVVREPKGGKEPYSDQLLAKMQGTAQPAGLPPKAPDAPAGLPAPEAKTPPAATAPAGGDEVPWIWPAAGKIIGTFSEGASKGVDIAGKMGDPVIAAGDGKVVYSGTGLRGYGKLVIIKHNATYLSAYAHNRTILVKEGESVSKGQKIAEMGNSDADQVKLHFEVRRQGKPVDPLKYLPPR